MNWELVLLGMTVCGSIGNFIMSMLLAKQTAEIKAWVNERFVAKKDFMDMMTLLGLPERPQPK